MTDPAAGKFEFPGGHIEAEESALQAAVREWQEETGMLLPHGGRWSPGWTSPNGVYQGLVYVLDSEDSVALDARGAVANPDDPDGDYFEAIAWMDPDDLPDNPIVRAELAADLPAVLAAIEHAVGSDPKAGSPVAKSWRDGAVKTPQHQVDVRLVDYWAPRIADALASLVTDGQLRAAIEAASKLVAKADADPRQAIAAAARAALPANPDPAAVESVLRATIADSYRIGGAAASRQLGLTADGLDWDTWEPGDVDAAIQAADGGLASLLDRAGVGVKGITDSALDDLGNAIADGVLDGLPVDDIASSLSDWATGFRAERIAHTESARSVDAASQAVYQANGIEEFDIVLSDGACEECEDAAADGPYPSGDSIVPVHPLCRCASSPHVPDDWTAPADDTTDEGDTE